MLVYFIYLQTRVLLHLSKQTLTNMSYDSIATQIYELYTCNSTLNVNTFTHSFNNFVGQYSLELYLDIRKIVLLY